MKIYVSGANGRIGKRLAGLGLFPLFSDVTDYQALSVEIKHEKPDIVLHLAAITDVEYCEKKENQEEVMKVNYRGTVNVASITHDNQCSMVFLSTDHIYNGKHGPYKEDYPYWIPNILGQKQSPVNYYGLSKLTAEMAVQAYPHTKIVRTSYLFDWDRMKNDTSTYFPNFMYRSFMHVDHFAKALHAYLLRFYEMPNILNISGYATVSWYRFAKDYYVGRKILPRKHDLKKEFAPRPYKTGLDVTLSSKLGLPQFSYKHGLDIL